LGKFDGILLASDYDDTLFSSDYQVSPENVAAIEYFTGQGGVFTIATGRAHRTFAPQAHKVPFNAPVILSNGALLYDFKTERPVLELPLPPQAPADLLALCAAIPTLGVECYHGDDVYIYRPNEYTAAHVRRVRTTWTEKNLAEMPFPWSKAVIQDHPDRLLAAQGWMKERFAGRYEVIFSNSVLLECTAKGATKGGMVLQLARLLGVERDHIYCVGDNQNDIPMLAASAIPFAPANCARAVKDWGARIVGSCDESCIAQIIDILDKMY